MKKIITNNIIKKIISAFLAAVIMLGSVYLEGFSVYADTKTYYKWTRVKTNMDLCLKLWEIVGNTDAGDYTDDQDYKARILIVGRGEEDYFYLASNLTSDYLGEDFSYDLPRVALKKLGNDYGDSLGISLGADSFYTENDLDTPFIKMTEADSPYKSDDLYTFTLARADENGNILTEVMDEYGKISGYEKYFHIVYRSDHNGLVYSSQFVANKILDPKDYFGMVHCNPFMDFVFSETNGNAQLVYNYVHSNGNIEVKNISYLCYSNGYLSASQQPKDADGFYIYLGEKVTVDIEEKDEPAVNPDDEDPVIDPSEEDPVVGPVEDPVDPVDEAYRYKWNRISDDDDFKKTFLDIATAVRGSDVYNTNKNILNTQDYNARIMIVSITNNGKYLLFKNGIPAALSASSAINVDAESFYTESSFGLPFAKLVQEGNGGGVKDFFAVRIANGSVPAESGECFISVSGETGSNLITVRSAKDVSSKLTQNSFSLSFYDSDSDKVHIEANLKSSDYQRYMVASEDKGICFSSSTEANGLAEGSFYVFLGQPMTEEEYNADIAAAKKESNTEAESTTSSYYEWKKVSSNDELNAEILRINGQTDVALLNQNITDDEDYKARILVVSDNLFKQEKVFLSGLAYDHSSDDNWHTNSTLPQSDMEIVDGNTFRTSTSLNAPCVKVFESSKVNDLVEDAVTLTPGELNQKYLYAFRLVNSDDKLTDYYLRTRMDYVWYQKDNGNGVSNYNCRLLSNYHVALGPGWLTFASSSSSMLDGGYVYEYIRYTYSAYAGIEFNNDSFATLNWSLNFKWSGKWKPGRLCEGTTYANYMKSLASEKTPAERTIRGGLITANSQSSSTSHLYASCHGNGADITAFELALDYDNLDPHSYIFNYGQETFDVYVGEKHERSAYSGELGGTEANFEGTLVMEDNAQIKKGETLTVNQGSTLIINGTVFNYGSIKLNGGTLIVNGTLRCIGKGTDDAYKILAFNGSEIMVMDGGSILSISESTKDLNEAANNPSKYGNIYMNNSYLSVYGLIVCNGISVYDSSYVTVEHGGIFLTGRYLDVETFRFITSDFEKYKDEYIYDLFAYNNLVSFGGVRLYGGSRIKICGLLSACSWKMDKSSNYSGEYITNSYYYLKDAMINW